MTPGMDVDFLAMVQENLPSVSLQNSGFVVTAEARQIKLVQAASGETRVMAARTTMIR